MKGKWKYIIPAIILLLFVAIRIALPFFIRSQINRNIDEMEGYSGGVDDVSLALLAGTIRFSELNIYDEGYPDPDIPFVNVPATEISIRWGQLFRGRVHSHIHIDSMVVNYVIHEVVEPEPVDIVALLQELIDFRVHLDITNSTINFADLTQDPSIEFSLDHLNLKARYLINEVTRADTLPTSVYLTATAMETGIVEMVLRIDYMKEVPDFDLELELEDIDLTHFNDFARSYGGFTFHRGELNMYTEAAAYEGQINGYIQPLLDNIEITPTEEEAGIFRQFYEWVLDLFASILESPDEEYISTQVEFEGRIDDPDVGTWRAVWLLLRNAFIEGFTRGIEDVVDFEELVRQVQ